MRVNDVVRGPANDTVTWDFFFAFTETIFANLLPCFVMASFDSDDGLLRAAIIFKDLVFSIANFVTLPFLGCFCPKLFDANKDAFHFPRDSNV